MSFELHCYVSTDGEGQSSEFLRGDESMILSDDKALAVDVESEIIAHANKRLYAEKDKKKFIVKYDRYSNDFFYCVTFQGFPRELKAIIFNKTIAKGYVLTSVWGTDSTERFYFVNHNID